MSWNIVLLRTNTQGGNMEGLEASIWDVGIKIFLVVWIVFAPVAITARLERIIKLLEDKK